MVRAAGSRVAPIGDFEWVLEPARIAGHCELTPAAHDPGPQTFDLPAAADWIAQRMELRWRALRVFEDAGVGEPQWMDVFLRRGVRSFVVRTRSPKAAASTAQRWPATTALCAPAGVLRTLYARRFDWLITSLGDERTCPWDASGFLLAELLRPGGLYLASRRPRGSSWEERAALVAGLRRARLEPVFRFRLRHDEEAIACRRTLAA